MLCEVMMDIELADSTARSIKTSPETLVTCHTKRFQDEEPNKVSRKSPGIRNSKQQSTAKTNLYIYFFFINFGLKRPFVAERDS
jgi:hypothetical protein